MTHGDYNRHSTTEVSIDALHSHCNLIYKVQSSFIADEHRLMVPDVPWAVRFWKFVLW